MPVQDVETEPPRRGHRYGAVPPDGHRAKIPAVESEGVRSAGPAAEGGSLVSLLGATVLREPFGRVVITPVVCRWCEGDRFEVAGGECFCEGCCLPVGMADGDVHAGGSSWRFAPPPPSSLRPGEALHAPADPVCPAGHDVFQVAVARVLAAGGRVRRLSVGLRCPVDGASLLHLDNVRVVATTGEDAARRGD
ncbi:hypothetical protein ACFQ7A_32205 [Streptomyces sp. NPDC056528]|uniref:hypothetical protein n=1 Tax=Streptomyces sp. NPDC056528 TaxID=3345854 RepID=UPI00368185FB